MTKKNKDKDVYPTIFVLEGAIRCYEHGSMLELYSQISMEEWETIVNETIHYKIFLECLKSVAIPILKDEWDEEDDWCRIQLEKSVLRMREIDSLLVAKYDEKLITEAYAKKMRQSATDISIMVEEYRKQHRETIDARHGINITSSDL